MEELLLVTKWIWDKIQMRFKREDRTQHMKEHSVKEEVNDQIYDENGLKTKIIIGENNDQISHRKSYHLPERIEPSTDRLMNRATEPSAQGSYSNNCKKFINKECPCKMQVFSGSVSTIEYGTSTELYDKKNDKSVESISYRNAANRRYMSEDYDYDQDTSFSDQPCTYDNNCFEESRSQLDSHGKILRNKPTDKTSASFEKTPCNSNSYYDISRQDQECYEFLSNRMIDKRNQTFTNTRFYDLSNAQKVKSNNSTTSDDIKTDQRHFLTKLDNKTEISREMCQETPSSHNIAQFNRKSKSITLIVKEDKFMNSNINIPTYGLEKDKYIDLNTEKFKFGFKNDQYINSNIETQTSGHKKDKYIKEIGENSISNPREAENTHSNEDNSNYENPNPGFKDDKGIGSSGANQICNHKEDKYIDSDEESPNIQNIIKTNSNNEFIEGRADKDACRAKNMPFVIQKYLKKNTICEKYSGGENSPHNSVVFSHIADDKDKNIEETSPLNHITGLVVENTNDNQIDQQSISERHIYSRSILIESIPSLLISLIGFTVAGSYLESARHGYIFQIYPLLLVSTCILSFKGNIELIFAMHLSSISNTTNLIIEYAQFAINNSCMVIVQSILIGFCVGIVGSSVIIVDIKNPLSYILCTICACIFSCFISTLLVLLILFSAITVFKNFDINPDNVILPSISAFSDYFTVCSLIFFFRLFHNIDSILIYICSLIFIFSIVPFIAYVSSRSPSVVPIYSILLLFLTFFLSSIAGFLLEYFSKKFEFLAISEIVFSGLTSSTSFIYLNRKLTCIYTQKPHNKKASLFSLLLISFAMSFTYILVSNTLFLRFSFLFSLLFITSFLLDVYLLIELIDFILTRFHRSVEIAGVVALPLITSLADFLGSFFLLMILFFTKSI